MKIWNAYASEHSMNLVMIGKFKEVRDAQEAKRIIELLQEHVSEESGVYEPMSAANDLRFSNDICQLLKELQFHSLSPAELGQFELDIRVEVNDSQVVIKTDEVDVSAFLKLLIDKGARVEVYSAHDYPDAKSGC